MPKRVLQGVVISDACDKTVIVRVERRVMHPIYKKFVSRSKKYAAHDEDNRYCAGDPVRIEESRPISKRKSWIVIEGPADASPGRGSRRAAVVEAAPEAAVPRRRRRTAAAAAAAEVAEAVPATEEAGGAA
jgi:small subunit ribosomal protein S17